MTATTALTAQNTLGVYDIHPVPPAFLTKQIDACFDDIGVDVVKTGVLRPFRPPPWTPDQQGKFLLTLCDAPSRQ